VLFQNRNACGDTRITDIYGRPSHKPPHLVPALAAERAAELRPKQFRRKQLRSQLWQSCDKTMAHGPLSTIRRDATPRTAVHGLLQLMVRIASGPIPKLVSAYG
jgi:hypothetical protein